jgi:hypothetical protein
MRTNATLLKRISAVPYPSTHPQVWVRKLPKQPVKPLVLCPPRLLLRDPIHPPNIITPTEITLPTHRHTPITITEWYPIKNPLHRTILWMTLTNLVRNVATKVSAPMTHAPVTIKFHHLRLTRLQATISKIPTNPRQDRKCRPKGDRLTITVMTTKVAAAQQLTTSNRWCVTVIQTVASPVKNVIVL